MAYMKANQRPSDETLNADLAAARLTDPWNIPSAVAALFAARYTPNIVTATPGVFLDAVFGAAAGVLAGYFAATGTEIVRNATTTEQDPLKRFMKGSEAYETMLGGAVIGAIWRAWAFTPTPDAAASQIQVTT